jgi:hypothetical protein
MVVSGFLGALKPQGAFFFSVFHISEVLHRRNAELVAVAYLLATALGCKINPVRFLNRNPKNAWRYHTRKTAAA